jgi:hypothetical protein
VKRTNKTASLRFSTQQVSVEATRHRTCNGEPLWDVVQSNGNCDEQPLLDACQPGEADPDSRAGMTYRDARKKALSGQATALTSGLQAGQMLNLARESHPSPKECTVMINTNTIAFLAGAPESFPSRTSPCRFS